MIYLDENGVTVKARKGAVIGKEYELNGKYYTVVDRQLLHNMYSSGMDLSLVVTTKITSLFSEFYWQTDFNQDISSWDVSNVKNMGEMFWGATSFNQDVSKWDVSKVEKMSKMFDRASSFNGDISNWNVENVVEFDEMFKDATSFNQNIGDWKLNKLISTIGMFHGALSFNQDLNNWNVSNTQYMQRMFKGAIAFNGKVDNWNTSKVTNMNEIFMEAKTFNQNISDWDVSNVKSMIRMFKEAVSFNQDIGNWNVSNVNRFDETFKGAENFNNDISSWNVSKAKNMSGMFNGAKKFNFNISNWNVKNVTETSAIFKNALAFNEDYNPFPKKVIKQKPIKKNDSGIELSSEEKNTISKIKKFLIERNFDKIDFGLELLISLNNVKLFETLLQGCKIELSQDAWEKCNKLKTNDFFTGTGPAQPFLNYALFCIIANAPEEAQIDKSIVRKNMTSIDLKVFFSEYDLPNKFLPIDKFSALSKLKMDLNIFKVEYNVVDKKFNRDDWFVNNNITHLELSNTSGSLKWFKNFSHLKSLKFGFASYSYPIEDIESFEYLGNLEELYLNNINQYEQTFKNIDFLKNCKKIKKFHLKKDNRYSLENIDVIKNFTELEELNINEISNELNLEALLSCKNLKIINLNCERYGNVDLDYKLFKNCVSLEKLKLYGFNPFDICGRISEIEGLKGLINLNKISFGSFNFFGINNGSLMTNSNIIINNLSTINEENHRLIEQDITDVDDIMNHSDSTYVSATPELSSDERKALSEIKKLLVVRDFDKIDLGLDKLISLNNIKLFETLLYGCKIELTQANQPNRFSHQMISNLRRNEFFTGTGPAQPYLNYALFCVIAHSPEEAKIDKSLVQKNMKSLDLKMFFSHYSSDLPTRFLPIVKFTALSFLKVDLSLFIEMEEGEHKKLNREDWFVNNKIIDLELSNTSGSLKWFKNFSQLKSLKFELGYCSHPIGDIESFEYLENLEELYFNIKNYYQGFKNIDFLKKCNRIKKFHLNVEQYYNCKLVMENIDVIKNFSELEELKIDGISSELNLGALLSCVKLKKLSIDVRKFDFKLLRNCTSLETLTLSHYVEFNINGKILDINQLKGLNNLKELTINNVQIKGIDNTVFL
jgi:surface protein